MNKNIVSGSKVKFPGNLVIGSCKGVVVKVYPADEESPAWAIVKPNPLPSLWPYNEDRFAPDLTDLTLDN